VRGEPLWVRSMHLPMGASITRSDSRQHFTKYIVSPRGKPQIAALCFQRRQVAFGLRRSWEGHERTASFDPNAAKLTPTANGSTGREFAVQPSQEPVLTEANGDPKHAFGLRFDASNRALYIDGRSGCSVAAKMNSQKHLNPWFQTLSYPEVSTVGAEIVQNSIDFECLTARTDSTNPGWKRPANTGLRPSLKPFLNDLRIS
jgi:hypothetical protein